MGLLSNWVAKESLKPGDHIYSWRAAYIYAHHGIYVGDDKVVHFTQQGSELGTGTVSNFLLLSSAAFPSDVPCSNCIPSSHFPCPNCIPSQEGRSVISSCLNCFLDGGALCRFEYSVNPVLFLAKVRGGTCTLAVSDPADVVVHRANYLLKNGFGCYNVFKNNCEDFAIYCKTGLLVSDRGVIGQGGQAVSMLGGPLTAFLSRPLRCLTTNVYGMVAIQAAVYCAGRYAADIGSGIRQDAVKVSVEDLTSRFSSGLPQMSAEENLEIDLEEKEVGATTSKRNRKRPLRKRRLKSNVWYNFELLPIGEDKKQRCKCKKCSAIYICDKRYGSGNLRRHLKECVRKDTYDIGQLLISQVKGSMSLSQSKFDLEKFQELLIATIVMHDLPFKFVEYPDIRALLSYLHPDLNIISRKTVEADVLKMYNTNKIRVKKELESTLGKISLTSNLWTSSTTDGYMCVMAHFIDENWTLHRKILSFSFMPPPHNGVSLAKRMYNVLKEYGIENKVFSWTLDDASANDSSIEVLCDQLNIRSALMLDGEFFHIRCCAHIINLIVQEGIKVIDEVVVKIRESVKYIKGSQARKQKFLKCVQHLSLDGKRGLRQDVPTRWDSTYLMLDSAIYYRHAFCHLELCDSNYKHCPSRSEWEKAEKINIFLSDYYELTCIYSGSKYPTANLYFPCAFLALFNLLENCKSDDYFMKNLASAMKEKFEKYWSDFSTILAATVILDPRYKFNFINFAYEKIYGGDADAHITHLKEKLNALFNEYVQKSSSIDTHSFQPSIVAVKHERVNIGSRKIMMEEFDTKESVKLDATTHKTQLELYLDEPRLDRNLNLDVLSFWKTNQCRYPLLAFMARDLLSIPISTITSELAFSIGGRIVDQYHSSLKPEIMEALFCTRDWLLGKKGSVATSLNIDEAIEDLMGMSIESTCSREDLSSTECSNA